LIKREVQSRTNASDAESNHEPGSGADHLIDVDRRDDEKGDDEDYGRDHGWCVVIILEVRETVILSSVQHDGGCGS
jgi:hypothetical protein